MATTEIQLGEVEKSYGLPEEVRTLSAKWDILFRGVMVTAIVVVFIVLNYRVIEFVTAGFEADLSLLRVAGDKFKPADRLISSQVVMSLIGATVVQVGISVVAIVSYLFPKPVMTEESKR